MRFDAVCVTVAVLIALIILIAGFVWVFQGNPGGIDNEEVIQRQLRGFGLILLAPIVGAVIILLCSL